MKALVLIVVAYAIGAYFVIRATIELATIDYGNPSSYRDDWGGPSLVGVIAVHCLPGVIALIAMVWAWPRVRAARGRRRDPTSR
jgi:hypothetical protein